VAWWELWRVLLRVPRTSADWAGLAVLILVLGIGMNFVLGAVLGLIFHKPILNEMLGKVLLAVLSTAMGLVAAYMAGPAPPLTTIEDEADEEAGPSESNQGEGHATASDTRHRPVPLERDPE